MDLQTDILYWINYPSLEYKLDGKWHHCSIREDWQNKFVYYLEPQRFFTEDGITEDETLVTVYWAGIGSPPPRPNNILSIDKQHVASATWLTGICDCPSRKLFIQGCPGH